MYNIIYHNISMLPQFAPSGTWAAPMGSSAKILLLALANRGTAPSPQHVRRVSGNDFGQ